MWPGTSITLKLILLSLMMQTQSRQTMNEPGQERAMIQVWFKYASE